MKLMDERNRYIIIRFISPIQLQEKDAWFIVSSELKRLFGAYGAAEVGLFLSYFDEKSQGGIFRAAHKSVCRVRTALCFIHIRHNNPLFLYSENVSGSLKKAKILLTGTKHIKRAHTIRKMLENYWEESLDDDTKLH